MARVGCVLGYNSSKRKRMYLTTIYIVLEALRVCSPITRNKQGTHIGYVNKSMYQYMC